MTETAARVTAWNIGIKWIGYAVMLYVIDLLVRGLYPSFGVIAATSSVLTAVGGVADWTVLQWLGNTRALSLGWFGMTGIIWGVAWLWPGVHVTLIAAGLTALCLGPLEYALHRWLFHVA